MTLWFWITEIITSSHPARSAYLHVGKITPAMRIAVQQISNCPMKGTLRNFYLEDMVRELLALRWYQYSHRQDNTNPQPRLSRSDIDRL